MHKKMICLGWVFAMTIAFVQIVSAQQAPAQKLDALIKAAQAEGELNLVAGGDVWGEESVSLLQNALNKKYGLNIKVRYAAGPSMPVMTGRVIETHKAGVKSDTDLLVANARPVNLVFGQGVTRPYPWRDVFPHVPADTIEAEGQLIRFVDVLSGMNYNTREIKGADVPRRLRDVLNPKWKGKIASTPYAAGLYFFASDRAWGYDKALEFIKTLSGHIGGLIRCGEDARIASGEFLMLVKNCGNYGGENYARHTGAPVGTVWDEDPSVIDSFYCVVPVNSAHPNLATLAVGFLMTKEGQDILYDKVGWCSASVEGTPVSKQYKEAETKGLKILKYTAASWRGEEGKVMSKAATEFAKILAGR